MQVFMQKKQEMYALVLSGKGVAYPLTVFHLPFLFIFYFEEMSNGRLAEKIIPRIINKMVSTFPLKTDIEIFLCCTRIIVQKNKCTNGLWIASG